MRLPGLACADCGAHDLLSVAPGDGEIRVYNLMLRRPVLCEGWCSQCWAKRWGAKQPPTKGRRQVPSDSVGG
jgi:hypothetical protein